jgi:hypothetical protein
MEMESNFSGPLPFHTSKAQTDECVSLLIYIGYIKPYLSQLFSGQANPGIDPKKDGGSNNFSSFLAHAPFMRE